MTVTVKHYPVLNRTPALPLAVRGWHDLIQQQHCSNIILISVEQQALVAFVDDVPAGVLTFEHSFSYNEISIGLGYIVPAHRGAGLYTDLWQALVAKARDHGVATITSATFLDNSVMRKVAAKQGRVEKTVTIDYEVSEEDDALDVDE